MTVNTQHLPNTHLPRTPTLTIVIVHFNTAQITGHCVATLLKVLDPSPLKGLFEIVVIDNRSEPDQYYALDAQLKALQHPSIILARSCINTGFGLGCMLGLNHSAGQYVAFVNSDTFFEEDCFTPLVAYLDAHPKAGVVTPQHLGEDGKPSRSFARFDSLRARLIGTWLEKATSKRNHPDPGAQYSEPVPVDFVFGSFMLFRLEALAVSGGFDAALFLYYEEMDICWRLREAGYETIFFPGASFRHIGAASTKQSRELRLESLLSLQHVFRKNRGFLAYCLLYLGLLLQYLLKAPFKSRNRWIFLRLLMQGPAGANSMRVRQVCNFSIPPNPNISPTTGQQPRV